MQAVAPREGRGELMPSVTLREGVDCLDIRSGSSRLPPLIRARHQRAYASHSHNNMLPARHPFHPRRVAHRFITAPPSHSKNTRSYAQKLVSPQVLRSAG